MLYATASGGPIVHLIDGTYELFRHFYGLRRFNQGKDSPFGAVTGVLKTVLEMIETGATHLGVATDHVVESFRNALWPGYKTGDGIEPRGHDTQRSWPWFPTYYPPPPPPRRVECGLDARR